MYRHAKVLYKNHYRPKSVKIELEFDLYVYFSGLTYRPGDWYPGCEFFYYFPCFFYKNFGINISVVTMGIVSTPMSLVVVPRLEEILIWTWFLPQRALPVKVTLQTLVSVVLASSNSVTLPPVSFGFFKQNTDSCFVLNYRNSKWLRGSDPSPVTT